MKLLVLLGLLTQPQPWLLLAGATELSNELHVYETCSWGYRGNPDNCNQYFQCNFGASLLRDCPPGLFWNPDVSTCDWPRSVRSGICRDRTAPPSGSHEHNGLLDWNREAGEDDTVIIQLRSKCVAGSFMKSTRDCGTYFICDHETFIAQQCAPGLHWNAQVHICDWPANAGCSSAARPPHVPAAPPTTTSTTSAPTPAETVTSSPAEPLRPSSASGKKVICYFTDWSWYRQSLGKFMPDNIDPRLCTHLVYSFALLDGNDFTIKPADSWADFDNKFYEKVTGLKAQGPKVTLALGGWNESGGNKYSVLVGNPQNRAKFINSTLAYLAKYNFDGLDLDWEYPTCWQANCNAGPASDKAGFASLVKEFRAALPKDAILSVAVSASKPVVDKAYDIPTIAQYVDWIGVMDYDFHGSWEKFTGHIAPLYFNKGDSLDYLNANFSIAYWLGAGAPKEKLIMGIPLYGQTWTLADPTKNGMYAAAYGPGEAGTYTRQGGVLSYYEICEKKWTNTVRSPNMGPYAYSGNQWVSFDDVESVTRKSAYINEMELGGGMIWALDFDDFTNACGQGKYPLLTAIYKTLRP